MAAEENDRLRAEVEELKDSYDAMRLLLYQARLEGVLPASELDKLRAEKEAAEESMRHYAEQFEDAMNGLEKLRNKAQKLLTCWDAGADGLVQCEIAIEELRKALEEQPDGI